MGWARADRQWAARPRRLSRWSSPDRLRSSVRVPIVLVTHDLDEAAALADRLVVIDRGELLQEGVPADVLGAPASDRVRNALDLPTVS